MRTEKFRPCLTSEQITHILSLCKKELSDRSLSVISVLVPFKAKIENNCISWSYSEGEKKSLIDSLGLGNNEFKSSLSPNEKRKRAYDKWFQNPDSCNVDELEFVRDYRYINGMMNPEEILQYEADSNEMLLKSGLLN